MTDAARSRVPFFLLSAALAAGCTAKSGPEPSAAKVEAKTVEGEAPKTPEAAPAETSGGPAMAEAEPETATGDTGIESETGGGEAEEEPPPPAVELPGEDPLRVLLGGDSPETVVILATKEHGRRQLVLYRVDIGQQWLDGRPEDDPVVAKVEEVLDTCEDEANMYTLTSCREEGAAGVPGVPTGLGRHLAHGDAWAWELAHVEYSRKPPPREAPATPEGETGEAVEAKTQKPEKPLEGKILARKRLLDFGLAFPERLVEAGGDTYDEFGGYDISAVKFKVYDVDGDERSEVFVTFGFELPSEDNLDQSEAAVSFVLDKTDLHIQFATTRYYYYHWSDVSSTSTQIDTRWTIKDTDGDGVKEIVVRETVDESHDDSEYEGGDTREKRDKKSVCAYDRGDDRWICEPWLGTEIVKGGRRGEVTSVPLPELEAPAESPG